MSQDNIFIEIGLLASSMSFLKALDRALALVQASSGLVFSSFTLLHLGGHALAPLSYRLADTALYATREIYQAAWVEPWLVGVSLVAHSLSSSLRVGLRYWRQSKASSSQKGSTAAVSSPALEALSLHRYTGYIMSVGVYGHVLATRLMPLWGELWFWI